jgi:hypothetical protein
MWTGSTDCPFPFQAVLHQTSLQNPQSPQPQWLYNTQNRLQISLYIPPSIERKQRVQLTRKSIYCQLNMPLSLCLHWQPREEEWKWAEETAEEE